MLKRLILFFIISAIFFPKAIAEIDNPVKWNYTLEKAGDNSYNLKITASIDVTWHMYGLNIPEGGPNPTTFKFEKNNGYELVGKVKEITKAVSEYDKSFEMQISYFTRKAEFVQKIKVLQSESFKIKGSVEYQCCNDQKCIPPKTVEFEFTIPKTLLVQAKAVEETKAPETKAITAVKSDSVAKTDSTKALTDANIANTNDGDNDTPKEPESAWGFLFYAFFLGLAGVLTPCVYPMIPMTVSFFMRGEEKRAKGIIKGLIFGLSIVAVYTLIGVLVSLSILSPSVGNTLSTHWIANLLFFLLFLVFAASFLGMFEMVLPSSLVNNIDKQADKGGFMGSFFMALTLVIVSFSCTGPIVGKILIESSKGLAIKPIAGMFGYSLAFALPFTFFALFPSLLKSLPKSGGWLNSVKVVLGFIVLAFSMSFLANIDQNYGFNLLSRDIFLSIWIVLSILLGMYLLGKIKFAHDSDIPNIGVPRFLLVVAIFSFSVYLFTGLLGSPLKSLSWILPPQENFSVGTRMSNPNNSNLCTTTPKYADFLPKSNLVSGYFDYDEGMACAKEKNKPVFIDFKGHQCKNCKIMEAEVFSDPRVLKSLQNDFVIIELYTDDKHELPQNDWITKPDGKLLKRMDEKNQDFQISKFNSNALPLYAILNTKGKILGRPIEFTKDVDAFLKFLKKGKNEFNAK